MQQSRERLNAQHPPPNVQVSMGPTHTQHWMPQAQAAPIQVPNFPPPESSPRIDTHNFPPFEAWYPADQNHKNANVSVSHVGTGPVSSTPFPGHSSFGLRQRGVPDSVMASPVYPQQPTPRFQPPPVMIMQPRQDLVRRPIHTSPSAASQPAPAKKESFSALVKTKMRSALGIPEPAKTPPGLSNNENNLCFLNCVLQCLANSPGIVEALAHIAQVVKCSEKEAEFVMEAATLLGKLRIHPSQVENTVEDSVAFREAASHITGSVVTQPSKPNMPQEQQDSAEYLMWMLSVLHNAINTHQQNNNHDPSAPVLSQQQAQMQGNDCLLLILLLSKTSLQNVT